MANEILCLINKCTTGSGKQVTNYMRKNGESFTEVVTDLGNGLKGVREIHPNKVIDRVGNRSAEEYVPFGEGVMQTSEGIRSYFPNINFSKLKQID